MTHQKPFRGIQINRTHPLVKGLVGCWVFNEATGKTSFDLSGHNNHGALKNGVAWNNGNLAFDGVNGYVDCGNNASLNINDTVTISARVYFNDNTENYIFAKDYPYESGEGYMCYRYINMKVYFDLELGLHVCNTPVLNTDTWYHIVAVFDGTTGKIYIDGEEKCSGAGVRTSTVNDLEIGLGRKGIGNAYFNGSIDSVYIYNRALSADEIIWLYKEPYAIFRRLAID